MPDTPLVGTLPSGPLDIIADVHGEIDALQDLLRHLGYDSAGDHAQGRRLVFLGDLVDRGPNSPGVVAMVRRLVEAGRTQCLMGNHELNILRLKRKQDNGWFYALPESEQAEILRFIGTLPLALERPDLRVAHAAWNDEAIEILRTQTDVLDCFRRYHTAIVADLDAQKVTAKVDRGVREQNENPVKVVNSGPEQPADKPWILNGEVRLAERARWWNSYDGVLCVVGHYWRAAGSNPASKHLFDDAHPYALLGLGKVMCIDYSCGWRFKERLDPAFTGRHKMRLTALRYPEMTLQFNDGDCVPVEPAVNYG